MAELFLGEAFGPQKLPGGVLALPGLLVMQQANRRWRKRAQATRPLDDNLLEFTA